VFLNPVAARDVLRPVAQWLAADRSRRIHLTGTTARVGSRDGQIALGALRAQTTERALLELGAKTDQVQADGVGSYFPEYTPDHDASGELIPGPAQADRTVQLTFSRASP
jgi:outer membrane protein OmpA-like peptidoglycan-associated protein